MGRQGLRENCGPLYTSQRYKKGIFIFGSDLELWACHFNPNSSFFREEEFDAGYVGVVQTSILRIDHELERKHVI